MYILLFPLFANRGSSNNNIIVLAIYEEFFIDGFRYNTEHNEKNNLL